jgi:LPS sulfotransferase NodH
LREPQFDPELIEQCLKEAERQEKLWQTFFQRIGVDPFRVEYERLCEAYEATIRAVLDFLRISLPRNARIGPPQTVRQADEISRIWEKRFLTERPTSLPPAQA